jgi:hypothetical protein
MYTSALLERVIDGLGGWKKEIKDKESDELHGMSANEDPPAPEMMSNKGRRGMRRRQRRDSGIDMGLL